MQLLTFTPDYEVENRDEFSHDYTQVPRPDRTSPIASKAQLLVDRHHFFHGRADRFKFTFNQGALIVQGQVPSFYLKQVLQTALKDIDGIVRIVNDVDVVSSSGLSSIGATCREETDEPNG